MEDIAGTNKCVIGLSATSMIWNEVNLEIDHGADKTSAKLHNLGDLPTVMNNREADKDRFVRVQYEGVQGSTVVFLSRKVTFVGVRVVQSPHWPDDLEINWKYGKSGN